MHLVNDLPPRWDGRPVVWRGWNDPVVIVCGKVPDRACSVCGSRGDPSINTGLVGDDADMSHSDIKRNDDAIRLAYRLRTRGPDRRAWIRLTAFRCPDCGHDSVMDDKGEVWDLDASDYTDEGSRADA